jgi:hypothetical protein
MAVAAKQQPTGSFMAIDDPIAAPAVYGNDRDMRQRLLTFFALVYVVEGLGQIGGLIAQPLNYYLKTAQGWTPVQITAFITLFNLPWIIKPLYGLISDFVPLFGYRRKGYLVLANVAAIAGFIVVTQLAAPSDLFIALTVTAYAMAISSTLCGAVLVENGQRLRQAAASSTSNGSGSILPPWQPPSSAGNLFNAFPPKERCTGRRQSSLSPQSQSLPARCF